MYSKYMYGKDKKGGYKVWSIWTEGFELYISHGKENGKMTTKCEIIQGKNIGRSNETSPEEQADLEAASRASKQYDKGYRESKEELEDVPLLPMLAHDYLKQGHRIKYPCIASPKLDGVRCLAIRTEEGVELKSRGGKLYNIPHVQEELEEVMVVGEVYDGELYVHGWPLEDIVSATKKISDKTKHLMYYIFDLVNDKPYFERIEDAYNYRVALVQSIDILAHTTVKDEEDMKRTHKYYVQQGYEGIMLRNLYGMYESGKRSADLQKYKEFVDAEFVIQDIVQDRNGNAVFVVWDDIAKDNFNVTCGDFTERKNQLENKKDYLGKYLNVKFQTRYKESRLPQFPCGIRIREVDENGEPTE